MNITAKKRKVIKFCFWTLSAVTMLFVITIAGIFAYAKSLGPPPILVPQSTIFYASDGSVIGETHRGQKRYWVPIDEISPHVIDATVAIEDRHFFKHHGFDYKRIIGAIIADIKSMSKAQGASTISQQYARNLFLEHDKTWKRKIHEAFYTLRLELNYSKEEILEGYLNTIYYGHGAYGIEAAANYYFDKPAIKLSLSEASILAGIPKGPSYYSPKNDFNRAKARQKLVLRAMHKSGKISEDLISNTYQKNLHLKYTLNYRKSETVAPYFQDIVKRELKNEIKLDERLIDLGGLKIYTTLNKQTQQIAEKVIQHVIDEQSNVQTALVSLDPQTGAIKAMVGGRDYLNSPFNRAVQAKRQPGSTFKPFVYYAALENGFTASTQLLSKPTSFTFDDGRARYSPHNYNNYYEDGPITMAQAIATSDNIYAVKTHMFLGIDTVVDAARKLGITSNLAEVPSLALGTSLLSVEEMTNAYGIIANGGAQITPFTIDKVLDRKGNILYERHHEKKQVLNEEQAFILSRLMEGMFDERLNGSQMRVTGATIDEQISRPVAGKSGSTPTDSWMIGFTPQLVTGVWVGYDDNRKIEKVKELAYAKKIWVKVMEESLKEFPVVTQEKPDGIVAVLINPQNGKLATEACPIKKMTYYVQNTEPTLYCTEHIKHDPSNDEDGRGKKDKDDGWWKQFLEKLF